MAGCCTLAAGVLPGHRQGVVEGIGWKRRPHEKFHRGCVPVPAALCLPAETDPTRHEADTDTVIDAFGKNEQVKKVFWTVFIVLAGFVLAQVVDPDTAQQIVAILTGM